MGKRVAKVQGLRWHAGRGLCPTCWSRAARRGVLADFPTVTYTRDELLEEWAALRVRGLGRSEAAGRLGVSRAAFERALYRARAAGDERAVMGVP